MLGVFEIDGDELADAALDHGDAEQAVHARHGQRMVGDDDEAGRGLLHHFLQQAAADQVGQ